MLCSLNLHPNLSDEGFSLPRPGAVTDTDTEQSGIPEGTGPVAVVSFPSMRVQPGKQAIGIPCDWLPPCRAVMMCARNNITAQAEAITVVENKNYVCVDIGIISMMNSLTELQMREHANEIQKQNSLHQKMSLTLPAFHPSAAADILLVSANRILGEKKSTAPSSSI
ncbi:hypothetical protein VTK26DRAFT_7918 [Humicola hyalothermophila]